MCIRDSTEGAQIWFTIYVFLLTIFSSNLLVGVIMAQFLEVETIESPRLYTALEDIFAFTSQEREEMLTSMLELNRKLNLYNREFALIAQPLSEDTSEVPLSDKDPNMPPTPDALAVLPTPGSRGRAGMHKIKWPSLSKTENPEAPQEDISYMEGLSEYDRDTEATWANEATEATWDEQESALEDLEVLDDVSPRVFRPNQSDNSGVTGASEVQIFMPGTPGTPAMSMRSSGGSTGSPRTPNSPLRFELPDQAQPEPASWASVSSLSSIPSMAPTTEGQQEQQTLRHHASMSLNAIFNAANDDAPATDHEAKMLPPSPRQPASPRRNASASVTSVDLEDPAWENFGEPQFHTDEDERSLQEYDGWSPKSNPDEQL
eukprot:TRINITY_DN10697_c0_g1_i1.p1 TRINITY_DN10697_c0_g1~~TRINITY_DN10697_c0_g1_i1.p1  ORF type:complete len:375 (-),score=80.56 TRINITY_DN10697_c0_g1_i1:61-1185(-)